MCGVIGLISERDRADLGQVATSLLKMLEYRGYDSTGAAIQSSEGEPILRKEVGAPSKVAEPLGIPSLSGRVFCGQVRWATFGSVDALNAQPHSVRCHTPLYGAHNGNVTNSDDLQRWLRAEGHEVRSDNDGEMLVHTVEHCFAKALAELPPAQRLEADARRVAMRRAIVRAGGRLRGSYAAIIVDPHSRVMWAIKAGSSLYFGEGDDAEGGRFAIASSDLSSVLTQTHRLVGIKRGDFVEYDGVDHAVFRLEDGAPVTRGAFRSRLLTQEITLRPPFETFMEQEISAQDRTVGKIVEIFGGGSERLRALAPTFRSVSHAGRDDIDAALHTLRSQTTDEGLGHALAALLALPAFQQVAKLAPPLPADAPLASSEAGLMLDLRGAADAATLALVDSWVEHAEVEEFNAAADRFAELCASSQARGGRTYVLCCGTSYHAAKAAALFFNEIAQVQLLPMLPGDFRGQCSRSLQDGDLLVAVSQSGETKDLVDAMTAAMATGRELATVALVNNVNSTIAQELASLVIPLHCGPEIAVPATKSFMNQLAVFYGLAVRLAERQLAQAQAQGDARPAMAEAVAYRQRTMASLPQLVRDTFDSTDASLDEAAELLYLEPSIHLLATRISAVAKEGALKIREVVLNHTEGFEASEFKHGPNTILGVNTLYGPRELQRLLEAYAALPSPPPPSALFSADATVDDATRRTLFEALVTDYPLVYITGPDPQDVQLTVSQVNTHKIRGSSTVMIAEEDPQLRQAATKAPTFNERYRSVYIALPPTGDSLLTVFSATVALQRLALKMSVRKAAYLDARGVRDHGVHPDVPKNVSKSITVD